MKKLIPILILLLAGSATAQNVGHVQVVTDIAGLSNSPVVSIDLDAGTTISASASLDDLRLIVDDKSEAELAAFESMASTYFGTSLNDSQRGAILIDLHNQKIQAEAIDAYRRLIEDHIRFFENKMADNRKRKIKIIN